MNKQSRSEGVMRSVLEAVAQRLEEGDESRIRIPEVCAATGVNYGSVYHHFGSREGVIDAAYEMLFRRLVDNDVRLARAVFETVTTREEFAAVIGEAIGAMTAGPERRQSRALRMRVVAVSLTRPGLRARIARVQAELTTEVRALVEMAQSRGWIPADFDAHAVAVVIQALAFGRNLDDASESPIDQARWDGFARAFVASLVGGDR